MSRPIWPFPLRDCTLTIYSVWRRGGFFWVTIDYLVRGEMGRDSRAFRFGTLAEAREALPPGLVMFSPDPEEDSPELVETWQ